MTAPLRSMADAERPLYEGFNEAAFAAHMAHDPDPDPDGCDLCFVRPMLADLRDVWTDGSEQAFLLIWSLSDGYGEPGAIPEQGYDWSGIRDSSPAAVRRMWQAAHA